MKSSKKLKQFNIWTNISMNPEFHVPDLNHFPVTDV